MSQFVVFISMTMGEILSEPCGLQKFGERIAWRVFLVLEQSGKEGAMEEAKCVGYLSKVELDANREAELRLAHVVPRQDHQRK